MLFNKNACTWTIQGDLDDVRQSNERRSVIAAMNEIGAPASPKDIADAAQMRANNVNKLLTRMAKEGEIHKHRYGKYALQPERNEPQPCHEARL